MFKWTNSASSIMLVFTLIIISFIAGSSVPLWDQGPDGPEFELVEEAWSIIVDDYVASDELDLKKLSQAAIIGMVEAMNDRYSAYLNAEQYQFNQTDLEGSFGGIGAEVTLDDEGRLTIVAPIDGTPAQEAGILPGDKILEVDGISTEGMSTIDAVLLIRGEAGTKVVLLILHKDEEEAQEIEIIRDKIKMDSVRLTMLPDNIAHIRISNFSDRTGQELMSILEEIISNDAIGIILDLRTNPGGLLTAAIDVVSQFVEDGMVTYVMYKDGSKDTYDVRGDALATDIPMVVLVNESSASASELVSGALQDHKRATVIGTRTFGKGSVNTYRTLEDDSAIYISIARWHTPDGRQIEGQGILPDETVELTEEDIENGNDRQLEKAIEHILNQ